MADNPWAGIQNLGAIDQKLYQPPKAAPVVPSSAPTKPEVKQEEVQGTPVRKPQKHVQPKKQEKIERKKRQLNAWITATQNDTLDRLYFRLRANGMQLQKGELVGVGIEILATILDQVSPKSIDETLLDSYLSYYEKQKQTKT
jgi:hypothetical protein